MSRRFLVASLLIVSIAVIVAVLVKPTPLQPDHFAPQPGSAKQLPLVSQSTPPASPVAVVSSQPQPAATQQRQQSIALGSKGLPPGVAYASDTDPVRITSVILSSDDVRGGDLASARVVTTSNAAALTARIGTYQVSVPRIAPGTFEISIKVPRLPVVGKTVDIVVTAIRSDGATAQKIVPVKVSF